VPVGARAGGISRRQPDRDSVVHGFAQGDGAVAAAGVSFTCCVHLQQHAVDDVDGQAARRHVPGGGDESRCGTLLALRTWPEQSDQG